MALIPDKTRIEYGLTIHEKIIPWGAKWTKKYDTYKKGDKYKADRLLTNNTGQIKGITIHNTPGDANAETYTRATYPNQNMKTARVHYYVDDKEVWQNLRDDEVGWHAGDGNGPGNDTTIAIEILTQGKAVKDGKKAEDNGMLLAAILMHKHSLTIKDIYTHKHWSGKNCPINILPRWATFLKDLEKMYKELKLPAEPLVAYRVQVGYYHVKQNAENTAAELRKLGFDTIIKEEKIAAKPAPEAPPTIKLGSKVRIKQGAKTYTGGSLASFVYNNVYTVDALKNDRAVLDTKGIHTPVNVKDLILV